MSACLYPEHRVRKTIGHCGSVSRRQHVYIRMTDEKRREYNQVIGGFKHFLGPWRRARTCSRGTASRR